MKKDTKALAEMNAAMKRLQSGGSVDVATFRDLQGRIDATKKSLAGAQQAFITAGGSFSRTYKKDAGKGLKGIGDAAKGMPGPVGQAAQAMEKLGGTFGSASIAMIGVVGAVALVAAGLALIVVGAAAASVALAKYALAVGDARRNEGLHFEAISRMRRGFGMRQRASGEEVMGAIDRVAASSATSREAISRFAETLQRGGLRGENFRVALGAAATRAAALGEESGQAFANMARGAGRAGVSVRRLADDVEARFGGIARRRLLSLDVITGKLSESFAGIFAGLNLDPALSAFQKITSYFSQTHIIGRAIKTIVTNLFQPMVDSAGNSVPLVKRMIQGVVIAMLDVTIAIMRARLAWKRFSSGATLNTATFRRMGADAVDGITFGILNRAPGPIAAIARLAETMGFSFKEALQIHSPSRVFAELGGQVPAGVAVGVESGTSEVDAAVREMITVPSASAMAATGATTNATTNQTSSSRSIQIGTINVHGSDAQGIAESIREALSNALEGVVIEMGVPA